MVRIKAALLHFSASAFILLLVFFAIKFIYYPRALFAAAAGFDVLRLLTIVDVILGPLITLIIFNPLKKNLKYDVCIVVACQLAFMSYGVWSIYSARPVYIAFTGKHFNLVRANEIDEADEVKAISAEFKHRPMLGLKYIGTTEPSDINVKNDLAFAGLMGMGIQNLPQYYVPYDKVIPDVKAQAKSSQQFEKIDNDMRQRLKEYEQKQQKIKNAVPIGFVPIINKRFTLFAVVNTATGEVVDIIR